MKIRVALFLCFVMLLTAVSCTERSAQNSNGKYDEIINQYQALLIAKENGEELLASAKLSKETEAALLDAVDRCEEPSAMGYATKDINGDGVNELVLLDKASKLYALFTVKGRNPVLLLNMARSGGAILPDGTVFASTYVKDESQRIHIQIKKIVSGTLEGLEFGWELSGEDATYYKAEDGVRTEIDRDEYFRLEESIQHFALFAQQSTKETGFRFVPALSDPSAASAPVADFSSYEAILTAYKRIVIEGFFQYTRQKWSDGEFDDLFFFPDNESYEIFHTIFYGGARARPTTEKWGTKFAYDGQNAYGYAKKDLNRDGIEELILLNDNYAIFAIFTMKDGKVIPCKDVYGAWIDENGRIYQEIATGGLVGRDGEAFVYEIGDDGLQQIMGVGYRVNIYLKKDEWYKIKDGTKTDISNEEGEALYAQFETMSDAYSPSEYTRTFSGLQFIPLFEPSVAIWLHCNTYSRSYWVGGTTLTISSVSDDAVVFSLEVLHTVGEFPDHETYWTTIAGEAKKNGFRYPFEQNGVKGYIEFAVNSAWVIVTESANEHVACKAYLFDYPEN